MKIVSDNKTNAYDIRGRRGNIFPQKQIYWGSIIRLATDDEIDVFFETADMRGLLAACAVLDRMGDILVDKIIKSIK